MEDDKTTLTCTFRVIIFFLLFPRITGFQNCPSTVVGVADSNIIPDSSFTASSSYNYQYTPVKARFTSDTAWSPRTATDPNDYLQIDLGKVFVICGVATKGVKGANEWTTEYKISTSINGTTYTWYPDNNAKMFTGNTDRDTAVKHTLGVPVHAKLIRFTPTQYNNYKALRVELYGVDAKASSLATANSGATQVPTPTTSSPTAGAAQKSTTTPGASAGSTPVIKPIPTTTPSASSTSAANPTPDPNAATVMVEARLKCTNLVYNDSLANSSSKEFKAVENKLKDGLSKILPQGSKLTVKNLTRGSVIIDFVVAYLAQKGVDVSANLTVIVKSGKIGDLTVDPKSLEVSVNIPGCTLENWKLDGGSYKPNCCKSIIGSFMMTRRVSGKCIGVDLVKSEDCGDAKDAPPCKGCSMTNISTAVIMLGLIASKIFL